MLRLAVTVVVLGTMIGAIMPSRSGTPSKKSWTSQSTGERIISRHGASASQVDAGTGTVTIERDWDGHFYADARVNGMTVRFLIDTGATGIALAKDDAQRAAVPMMSQSSEVIGSGASGEVRGQFVALDRVELGSKEVRGVSAVVLEGGEQSLLGQSFLAEFGSVAINGDTMTLR